MSVTREEILRIAELAKLHFEEEELDAFTVQFQRILDYIEKLRAVPIEGVEDAAHVPASADAAGRMLREDCVTPSLAVGEALGNAPDSGRGHFKVPKVI